MKLLDIFFNVFISTAVCVSELITPSNSTAFTIICILYLAISWIVFLVLAIRTSNISYKGIVCKNMEIKDTSNV